MEEKIFPPSPSWHLANNFCSREDGSVVYGSKCHIVILKVVPNENLETIIIRNAHTLKYDLFKVTSVIFSPPNCSESVSDTVVSCSEDGFVKLWKIDSLTPIMAHNCFQKPDQICLDWSLANPHHIVSAENNILIVWDILSNTTVKYSFQKLGATVIACCPYNEKIVAVGSKTGQIYIVNLTGKGDITYRLRGHDNKIHSLSWCPVPYNVFHQDNVCQEFLLASACQDKEIFIWKAGTDGKCELKLLLPTSSIVKKDGNYGKLGNNFSYSALLWSDPYKLFLSSNFGELLYFDIKSYIASKQLENSSESPSDQKLNKHLLNFFKLGHCCHSKGLFAIAGSPFRGELIIYNNSEIYSNLKFKILANNCNVIKSETEDEEKKKMCWEILSTKPMSLLWTAGQDRQVVACKLNSSKLEVVFDLHTLNGVVYCGAVSPHDPNKIAIGVGDGMIRLWNLTGDIKTFWKKVQDRIMALAWHPSKDGHLAYGTSKGRVGIVDTNSQKLPHVFKPSHPKPIYNLSWGPQFPPGGGEDGSKSEFHLYSLGDNTLSVYNPSKLSDEPINLSKIIQFPCKKQTDVFWKPDYSVMAVGNEDGTIYLVEPSEFKIVHTVLAYKKLIQSIAWHPSSTSVDSGLSPYLGYFTSGTTDTDNGIRVFNYQKENAVKVEQVATLKGHFGQIQSVSWCPHVSGRLLSCSTDNSVQIWNVITQTPLANYTITVPPLFSLWSPVDSDIILTGCRNSFMSVWRISKQKKILPEPQEPVKKPKKHKITQNSLTKEIGQGDNKNIGIEKENVELDFATPEIINKCGKEEKMFSKAWKGAATDEFKICYNLLKNEKTEGVEAEYSLPFFCGEAYFNELVQIEEEFYKRANNWTKFYELSVLSGNFENILKEKTETGHLNDFLVSLAPAISPRFWQKACLSYSKSLVEKKLYRKAATYLIVCHKIFEAIELLVDAKLYLEALCIAQSRLPKSDPVVKDIVRNYADWLFKNGAFLKACECYIYLEDYQEVAKVCGKKAHPEYLSLAALAARKCGLCDLESQESANALLKCFETNNFDLARKVCDDHHNLKQLRLLYNMYNTIHQLDTGELCLDKDILSYVKETFDYTDVVFHPSTQNLYNKYTFYKDKRQVLIIVSQELSFAVCSTDKAEIITHLIKALSTCCRFIQTSEKNIHPLYKLCTWISPSGFLTEDNYFTVKDNDLASKGKSLRAFLCAAIVRNLNDDENVENVTKCLDVISEVAYDLLDEESYQYFRNLIDVEICEKRLMTNKNQLARKKVIETGNKNLLNNSNGETTTEETAAKSSNENLNLENGLSENLNLNDDQLNKKENEENVEEIFNGTVDEKATDENSVKNDTDLEEKIQEDIELLDRYKKEIESFEMTRISSPNPVPVYCMLKKLLESISESETAKSLLENFEERWQKLNKI